MSIFEEQKDKEIRLTIIFRLINFGILENLFLQTKVILITKI